MEYLTLFTRLLLSLTQGYDVKPDTSSASFSVHVDTSSVRHVVDERYMSVSINPAFIGNDTALNLFRTRRFSALLKGLSPCYLRMGENSGNFLKFDPTIRSREEIQRRVDLTAGVFGDDWPDIAKRMKPGHEKWFTVYGDQWDFINELAMANGARLMYQINDLKRSNGVWNDTNFRQILDFTLNKPYIHNLGFEFGNEPDFYARNYNLSLSPQQHAEEFLRATDILRKVEPYAQSFNMSLVVAPDVTAPSQAVVQYLSQFLQVAGGSMDRISWHEYNFDAKADQPLDIANFTDPAKFDKLIWKINTIQSVIEEAGLSDKKAWLGESGSASSGGVEGLSDTFVAGFLWLDKLGLGALHGLDVIVRQTLYSKRDHYGLIDAHLNPRPDYWLSHVYKQLVGSHVFSVNVSRDADIGDEAGIANGTTERLRCYASNTLQNQNRDAADGVTLYCVNMYDYTVNLNLRDEWNVPQVGAYVLEAYGTDGLKSRGVSLNGQVLEMTHDDQLPTLTPQMLDLDDPLPMPAHSMAFFTMQTQNSKGDTLRALLTDFLQNIVKS